MTQFGGEITEYEELVKIHLELQTLSWCLVNVRSSGPWLSWWDLKGNWKNTD